MAGRFRSLGDLPPDHGEQLPGYGRANGPYPGTPSTSAPGIPGGSALTAPGSATPSQSGQSAAQAPATMVGGGPTPSGTAHPLYKAGNYTSIDYFGTAQSILVSTAKNRVYLGIQNNGSAGNIYIGFGTNAGNGAGLTIVPGFLWDNTFKPPGNNIYVWAPAGVRFTITEGL